MLKKGLYFSLYLTGLAVVLLLALETVYRHQLIDFYRPELRAFNLQADLRDHSRKTLLVMGDSFSAGLDTWVGFLRPKLPSYRIICGAIPGTGIFEALYTAPRRFQEFKPRVFIYQIFVGNDLQDIRRPLNRHTMSLARYAYCYLCSYLGLRSLTFANYRLAQLLHSPKSTGGTKYQEFSVATYPESVRIYYQAEPYNLEDTVMARGDRARDLETLIAGTNKLFGYCGRNCRKYVVVIPDSAQASDFYLNHMLKLGARFVSPSDLHRDDYPFLTRLQQGLADKEIKVLNPLPLFKADEAQGKHLYYVNQTHLNETGQAILGEYLRERLQADGLAR
jgi:hypothetical protein